MPCTGMSICLQLQISSERKTFNWTHEMKVLRSLNTDGREMPCRSRAGIGIHNGIQQETAMAFRQLEVLLELIRVKKTTM